MNLDELRQHIRELKSQWDSLQPLKPEDERRLWQKLRLEWNYNSNHIEGNTLTYGETVNFLLHDQTTGNHTGREYEEIKAHDAAVEWVRKLAQESADLSEADIRNLNQLLLKEAFWKEAFTPDGQPTRIEVKPGQYKTAPNSVKTVTGEIVSYASPTDVPIRMAKLVEFLKNELSSERVELGLFLAKLHDEFLLIHPFDDGNGRVARLLINYVLLRKGYPPIIIKSADKKNYLTVLHQADVGEIGALEEYLLRQLEWSLELGIKAAKGESVEEPTDAEKEIEIFVKEQALYAQQNREKRIKRSRDVLYKLYHDNWKQFLAIVEEKTAQIRILFAETAERIIADGVEASQMTIFGETSSSSINPQGYIILVLNFREYLGNTFNPFDVHIEIKIECQDYEYAILVGGRRIFVKNYSQMLSDEESQLIVQKVQKTLLEEIKKRSVLKS